VQTSKILQGQSPVKCGCVWLWITAKEWEKWGCKEKSKKENQSMERKKYDMIS